MPEIGKVIKGSAPSLLSTEKANELISAINGLARPMAVSPIVAEVDDEYRLSIRVNEDALGIAGTTTMDVTICVNGSPETKTIVIVES